MISVDDIAIMVGAIVQLSSQAVVPEIVIGRAGSNGASA
jgi:hypothetical protein